MTIRDNKDHTRVLLYSDYIAITGWGVLLMYSMFPSSTLFSLYFGKLNVKKGCAYCDAVIGDPSMYLNHQEQAPRCTFDWLGVLKGHPVCPLKGLSTKTYTPKPEFKDTGCECYLTCNQHNRQHPFMQLVAKLEHPRLRVWVYGLGLRV